MDARTHGAVYNFIPEHEVSWRNHRKTLTGLAYFWTRAEGSTFQPHGWMRLTIQTASGSQPATVKVVAVDPNYSGSMNKRVIGEAASDYIQRVMSLKLWTYFPFLGRMAMVVEAARVTPTEFKF